MTRYLFSLQHNSTVSCLYFCLAPLLVPEVDLLNQMMASPRHVYSVVALGLRVCAFNFCQKDSWYNTFCNGYHGDTNMLIYCYILPVTLRH